MNIKAALDDEDYILDLCVRMAHHSTAIEGNTLSQDESANIILNQFLHLRASEREFYEVRNYRLIMPFFVQSLKNDKPLNGELIKAFHALIMKDLHDEAGHFKKLENVVVGANFEPTKPYLVPTAIKDWCENLDHKLQSVRGCTEKLQAILESHIAFERIHPFSDGNGRTGRVLIVYSCFANDLPPLIIPKDEKARYISFLRGGDMLEFVEFSKSLQILEKERMQKFSQTTKRESSDFER